jgi:DNA-binding NarL/FixJ family response regulator
VVTAWGPLRGARVPGVVIEAHADPYDALLSAAREPVELVVLPAVAERFDTAAAVASLRRAKGTSTTPIVVVGASAARAAAFVAAGATRVLRRASRQDDLTKAIRELLALE